MTIRIENAYSKHRLAQKGPPKVFGKDVDHREYLKDAEAIAWFEINWKTKVQAAVRDVSSCDRDSVRNKVPHYAQHFIDASAKHREFTLAACQFICQLTDEETCDQLWFIHSTSGDPPTLYVKLENVSTNETFDDTAKRLRWQRPEELAKKILRFPLVGKPQKVSERERWLCH